MLRLKGFLRNLLIIHYLYLQVSNVRLSIIPSSFCCLTNLKHFNASSNAIESLPNHLFDLVNLIHLNLSDNELVFLPGGLGKLHKLTVLNLAHNKIYDVRELEKLDTLLVSFVNTYIVMIILLMNRDGIQTYAYQGGRGHWVVYNTIPPKFYNKVFLFVGLTTLGTSI